jgi:type VI secretion system protein ImpA
MPTPPLIDFDALTAPIPGPNPAGKGVPFAVREQLEQSRKEVDPKLFDKADPLRPTEEQRADWGLVVKLTSEALTKTSKDLLVAARLTEALTKRHGFAGVRDGLGLMRRMVEGCWDRLFPPIEEEDDAEVRAAAFTWLNDPDRGSRFPHTLRAVTLVGRDDNEFAWRDWKATQTPPKDPNDKKPAELKAAFEKAVQTTPREFCQNSVDDLKAALAELDTLDGVLDTTMGRMAPAISGVRDALGQCLILAEQILSQKGPAPASAAAPPAEAASSAPAEESAPAAAPAGPKPTTRFELYQRIAETSAALKVLEPHSPIPYLLERAVELGALSFPELMKVLVRNPEVLNMMNRELGIPSDGEAKK